MSAPGVHLNSDVVEPESSRPVRHQGSSDNTDLARLAELDERIHLRDETSVIRSVLSGVDPSARQQIPTWFDRHHRPRTVAPETRVHLHRTKAPRRLEPELEASNLDLVLAFWELQERELDRRTIGVRQ